MSTSSSSQENNELSRPDLIRKLLKGIETGDPESATVVNEAKYIQHNPQTREGSEGLAALFARISKSNPKVNVVRAMQDGDYVFIPSMILVQDELDLKSFALMMKRIRQSNIGITFNHEWVPIQVDGPW